MEAEQGARGAAGSSAEGDKSNDHKPGNENNPSANGAHPGGPTVKKADQGKEQGDIAVEKRETSSKLDGGKQEIHQAKRPDETKKDVGKEPAATPANNASAASDENKDIQQGESSAPSIAQLENAGEVEDSQKPDTPMAVDDDAPEASAKTVYNISEGFKIYCLANGKKSRSMQKAFAMMRVRMTCACADRFVAQVTHGSGCWSAV
eukprot:3358500-Rhodomonas_salina.1